MHVHRHSMTGLRLDSLECPHVHKSLLGSDSACFTWERDSIASAQTLDPSPFACWYDKHAVALVGGNPEALAEEFADIPARDRSPELVAKALNEESRDLTDR